MKLSDSLTFMLALNMITAHAFAWNTMCKTLVALNSIVLIFALLNEVITALHKQ